MPATAIAIIPARGGSKRVPKKNIRSLFGKPMIGYTIEAAIASGLFARIIVSTDCQEIANISLEYGAEVPFIRSAELADDFTPVSAVTLNMLQQTDPEGSNYHLICQLMANCPLRNSNDIKNSSIQFTETNSSSQISVVRYGWQNPWWAMKRNEGFTLDPLFPNSLTSRSQDLPDLYCPTGAIWWAKSEILREHGSFHVPGRTGFELSWQHGMDIDTEEDWELAKIITQLELSKTSSEYLNF